ncbi:MAG: SxtJ family membrane protein [candidate division KSB1 bacterium]|nr:SxtJ family membrane protein [candidate division KSB1 bacterium]MDZ7273917.1 SxtJ family membrane protein [candidate division KSB1 bacterium]MDZ7286073.1 SxtJ family membrane protein [candidate division KSB1 bacterium]MDZ7299105.1 SxtJ family membrane protein [candidate division KSB1 bacterium]MDZ7306652.1 SxtJ family membrane protein [candidate division KSB1 bacterium]
MQGKFTLRQEIRQLAVTPARLKVFGLTVGLLLLLLAAYWFWREKAGAGYFLLAAVTFAGVGMLAPRRLAPVYRGWMALALAMGFVMTRVILTLLYLGLFTPIGLLARLLGKDLLQQRWEPHAQTYWVRRTPGEFKPEAAEKMF